MRLSEQFVLELQALWVGIGIEIAIGKLPEIDFDHDFDFDFYDSGSS
jgi:hypothetical protein